MMLDTALWRDLQGNDEGILLHIPAISRMLLLA
jgi:hypothetical protein